MIDKLQTLELAALRIDDVALDLRSLGIEDIAEQLDAAREALEARCAPTVNHRPDQELTN